MRAKNALCRALVLSLMSAGCAQAQQWMPVRSTSDGTFFIDPGYVSIQGEVLYYKIRFANKNPFRLVDGKPGWYVDRFSHGQCIKRHSMTDAIELYAADGRRSGQYAALPEAQPELPRPIEQVLLHSACSRIYRKLDWSPGQPSASTRETSR